MTCRTAALPCGLGGTVAGSLTPARCVAARAAALAALLWILCCLERCLWMDPAATASLQPSAMHMSTRLPCPHVSSPAVLPRPPAAQPSLFACSCSAVAAGLAGPLALAGRCYSTLAAPAPASGLFVPVRFLSAVAICGLSPSRWASCTWWSPPGLGCRLTVFQRCLCLPAVPFVLVRFLAAVAFRWPVALTHSIAGRLLLVAVALQAAAAPRPPRVRPWGPVAPSAFGLVQPCELSCDWNSVVR